MLDAELVTSLIRDQFPAWSGLAVVPVQPGGWDHRTFRLGPELLVRLPSRAIYAPQVDKEQRWLPVLAPRLPLPIPTPVAQGKPGNGYPWSWSVYRWLEGSVPSATSAIDLDLGELARELARFLRALHGIDATLGPRAGEHNFFRGGPVATYDAETRDALAALADRIDVARATAIWEAALASQWQLPNVWVHGDMAASNLLVRGGRLAAVIDFGSCGVGDPACDLTIAWTFFAGPARSIFREALSLDPATWQRARGWALWKALIVACGKTGTPEAAADAWRVLDELLTDPLAL
ncbi:MAG TPA: aminoglycoside phosphotransferase family protein [Polyangiaceae bacterium]|jgi:aminoglycoside phosphotransferase (APT) family kinase protein|nr:aminoglycoside phosphotransferase family protein [Polyangiaceae bacterium]